MKHTNGNPGKIKRNYIIAQDRVEGMTVNAIGSKHSLTGGQISNILADSEVQAIMDEQRSRLIALVPTAVDNFQTILKDKENGDNYKASKDILQANGFLATHAPAPQNNTYIYNDNRTLLSPTMAALMQGQSETQQTEEAEYDVIE